MQTDTVRDNRVLRVRTCEAVLQACITIGRRRERLNTKAG